MFPSSTCLVPGALTMIILHHYDVDVTCCQFCAAKRIASTPEETPYLYSVELYPHEVVTCNDCDEEVKGEEEEVTPQVYPSLNQYK